MMNPISADEWASISADLAVLLTDDCEITRNTVTSTPDGWNQNDQQSNYTTVGTTKCMKTTPSPALLQAAADRLSTLTIWRMLFPDGADVRERDILIVNGESFRAEVHIQGTFDPLLSFLVSEVV